MFFTFLIRFHRKFFTLLLTVSWIRLKNIQEPSHSFSTIRKTTPSFTWSVIQHLSGWTKLLPPMPFTKTVESDFAFIELPSKNLLLQSDCSNDPKMLPIFQTQHRTSMCQLPLRLLPVAHQFQTQHFFCHQFHREQP